jgi:AraC family L-rhamnose operon regulatory protein RhaS
MTAVRTYRDRKGIHRPDTHEPIIGSVRAGQLRMESLGRDHYPGRRIPRGALPGLLSVGFFHSERRQTWGTGWHRNEGIEIMFVETGHVGFSVEGGEYALRAGDLTYTDPWQPHCLGNPHVGATRVHWFVVDVGVRARGERWRWPAWIVLTSDDRRDFQRLLARVEKPVWQTGPDVTRCFQRIAEVVQADRFGERLSLLAALVNEVLALLLAMQRRPAEQQELTRGLRAVEEFWADLIADPPFLRREWTVRRMAAECGLSASQFARHTRQLTNQAPAHYLTQCRLEAAAEMLVEQPERQVTDIALACGFSSSQYFSGCFRRRFGCSPQVYRIQQHAPT